MQSFFAKKRDFWIFIVIMIISLLVRVVGFNWGGDGTTFHPDEGKVYKDAIIMARNHTVFSASTIYPAQFSQKLLFVLYSVYFKIAKFKGLVYSEVVCIYIARVLTAIFGSITVFVSYFIAEGFRRKTGNVCALLVGCCSPLVQQAHSSVMDTEVGCCFAIALLLSQLYFAAKSGKKEYIILMLMALVCSIGTMEKWYGATITLIVLIVVVVKNIKESKSIASILKQGFFSLAFYIIGLFLIAPNLFIFYRNTAEGIRHVTNDYETNASTWSSLYAMLSWTISYMGLISIMFLILGIRFLVNNKIKNASVLVIGLIEAFYMTMSGQGAHLRWLQPLFICYSIVAAIGILEVFRIATNRYLGFKNVGVFLAVVSIINIVANGILGFTLYAENSSDTANICQGYLEEHNIKPESCIYDRYTCIRPAGYSLYYDSVDVRDSFKEMDGQLYVAKLGRNYALTKDYTLLNERAKIHQIKSFESDYYVNKMTNTKYDAVSWKWLDPYSICESLYYSIGFWRHSLTNGFDYYLSDISNIKGLQYISFEDADLVEDELVYKLSAIRKGNYSLKSQDGVEGLKLILRDVNKNKLVEVELDNREKEFEIDNDYINIELILSGDDKNYTGYFIER